MTFGSVDRRSIQLSYGRPGGKGSRFGGELRVRFGRSKLGILDARPHSRDRARSLLAEQGARTAMQMKPIGWTKRRVQLRCESCGARCRVEWLPYISALESGVPLRCRECGAVEVPLDRRAAVTAVAIECRTAART